MKELEKTKRISIAATLTILIVLIAVLSFERPKHLYKVNSANTLEKIISTDYFVALADINNPNSVLVDVRSQFEFENGHLENAVNIPTAEILSTKNSDVFKEIKENNKTAVLYGTDPNEVNAPFMLLYQLGYDNLKILTIKNSYVDNKLVTKNVEIENSAADIKAFIAESVKKANEATKKKVIVRKPKPVKKVIKVKKKKKAPAEGGC